MNWQQQRQKDLDEQMLQIVCQMGECEKSLNIEDDPQRKAQLEAQIDFLKQRQRACQQELESLNHQQVMRKTLVVVMPDITSEDLDLVITALLKQQVNAPALAEVFILTDPEQKMSKNCLTQNIRFMLDMGLAKAREVHRLIENLAKIISPDVPVRIKTALGKEYSNLVEQGIHGDELFIHLHRFASRQNTDPRWQAAGLALLCYFFETCEVFDP